MTTDILLEDMRKWEQKQKKMRDCAICGTEFRIQRRGTRKYCSVECSAEGKKIADQKNRARNKERDRENAKRYYREHTAEREAYCIKYREANREKISQQRRQRVKCDVCNKEMSKAALHRHKKNIHES